MIDQMMEEALNGSAESGASVTLKAFVFSTHIVLSNPADRRPSLGRQISQSLPDLAIKEK